MRVLCCPDSFKESISAADAAEAMARGVRAAGATADVCPLADGGEGTVEALVAATGGAWRTTRVTGPLGEPVEARWGLLADGRTAVIELAAAAGLALVPIERRNPLLTTTFGVGELIAAAMDRGVSDILLGIGGSATTDGGCGAAQALGARFPGSSGFMTGGQLIQLTSVDLCRLDPRLRRIRITLACDVTNPLCGSDGAAHVYGPQKGATPQQVRLLDEGLKHLAALLDPSEQLPEIPGTGERGSLNRKRIRVKLSENLPGNRPEAGISRAGIPGVPGAGAAGGFGFGAMAMLGATMRRGIELVLDAVKFDQRAAACDLILTGEGKLDSQTMSGKTIAGLLQRAGTVPVIALVGRLEGEPPCACRVIGEGLPAEVSMRDAARLLEAAARTAVETRRV